MKVGRIGGARVLAVIEPWHGTTVAIYREPAKPTRGPWTRQVIDETLTGGHAIGWLDVDGDGSDELVAGWREKDVGVALYRITSATERPARVMIDAGGMACRRSDRRGPRCRRPPGHRRVRPADGERSDLLEPHSWMKLMRARLV